MNANDFSWASLLPALPEIYLTASICLLLLVDVFFGHLHRSFTATFTTTDVFTYHCLFHPGMFGVVNVIDGRIPDRPLSGFTGRVEPKVGGADDERSLGAVLEAGDGTLAWHADVFGRKTGDTRIPGFARSAFDCTTTGPLRIPRARHPACRPHSGNPHGPGREHPEWPPRGQKNPEKLFSVCSP